MSVRPAITRKLKEWFVRYAPAEIGGTAAALFGAWVALHMTGSLAAAAVAGTIAENIGYYGVASVRDVRAYWQSHAHHIGPKRAVLTAYRTVRSMLFEFGIAEVIDSFFVRPGLMYLVPALTGGPPLVGILVAKLLADVVFYGIAITMYEIKKITILRQVKRESIV